MSVQLHTPADARREIYKRDRAKKRTWSFPRGFGPDSFSCIGIGVALGDLLYGPIITPPVRWGAIFAGAYRIISTELGLTYGTPVATGTTPPVGTQSGALTSGVSTPILFKPTTPGVIGAGAVFAAYADGTGTTPFMTGITPSAGVPVALTGPAAGVSMAWAAGTAAADNVWKATAAQYDDQSGNGKHLVQTATPTKQPIVTPGLNGCAGCVGDGVDDQMTTAGLNLPAPGTTPVYTMIVARKITAIAGGNLIGNGDASLANQVYDSAATNMLARNGTQIGTPAIPALGNWFIVEWTRSNSASDPFKAGANTITSNAGNSATTVGSVFASPGAGANGNYEILVIVDTPVLPNWAAVRAAVTSKYTAAVTL